MEWYRGRKATTKHQITLARVDLAAHIKAELTHEAKKFGADPLHDAFVYSRRDEDWYITFGLDVNPPAFAVEKMRARGWDISEV